MFELENIKRGINGNIALSEYIESVKHDYFLMLEYFDSYNELLNHHEQNYNLFHTSGKICSCLSNFKKDVSRFKIYNIRDVIKQAKALHLVRLQDEKLISHIIEYAKYFVYFESVTPKRSTIKFKLGTFLSEGELIRLSHKITKVVSSYRVVPTVELNWQTMSASSKRIMSPILLSLERRLVNA
ncbi:hypothetical protein [Photobacterium leiognathi]|uniref:hypothetical protein n=1 Tax=Photobacterium leiognathi TaxID=553611 RepID=UPI002980EE07|nr:hypothetical protein [Photobacterium leiognathi]